MQYKLSSASNWTTVSTPSTAFTVTGLLPNSTYNWQVQTICSSGQASYTPGVNFNTLQSSLSTNTISTPDNYVLIYPNPSTTGKFTCEVMNPSYGKVHIIVYDAAGRMVSSSTFNKETDFGQVDIEIANQQPGIYFVNLSNDDFQQHVRVIYAN